jgi:hypothetical protein
MLDRWEQSRNIGDIAARSGFSDASMENRESEAVENHLIREFISLATPVIGASSAEDLCVSVMGRLRTEHSPRYRKIGFIAAFLLGDFDDDSMELDDSDWENVRETLEDASTGMRLETLTSLMGELLSRGKLD